MSRKKIRISVCLTPDFYSRLQDKFGHVGSDELVPLLESHPIFNVLTDPLGYKEKVEKKENDPFAGLADTFIIVSKS